MKKEKALFVSKGLPKRIKVLFALSGIVWISSTILHFAGCINTAKNTMSDTIEPSHAVTAELSDGTIFSSSYKNSPKWGITDIISISYTSIMGIVYVVFMVEGHKLSLKIYDTHIEGRAGVNTLLKNVYVPIDQICFLSAYTKEMVPSVMIRTLQGYTLTFYMGAKKAAIAEQTLRDIIDQNDRSAQMP